VVASQGKKSNPTFRRHQGRPMSGRLFFFITLKVGADNYRNQADYTNNADEPYLGVSRAIRKSSQVRRGAGQRLVADNTKTAYS